MNILVVQHIQRDPIGVLGDALIHKGATLSTWRPEKQPAPPEGEYEGLIVLGGPMNAHEDDAFPHLRQTVELIHTFHGEDKPIMGVCLGAQLIARAFGSTVYRHTQPELGFSPVHVVDSVLASGASEPWLQGCPAPLQLMQWHFDTFDLPPQATLLMTNEVCPNQAYRIGTNIYGFQFHLEITPAIALSWLEIKSDWIAAHYPHLDQQIKDQLDAYAPQSAQFAWAVAAEWLAST